VALNYTDMKSYMLSVMAQTSDRTTAHQRFSSSFNTYVTDHIDIRGVYAGVIPGDPDQNVGGTYYWDGVATINYATIIAAAANCGIAHPDHGGYNVAPWVSAMQAEMRSETIVVPTDRTNYVTHTGRDFSPLVLVIDFWTQFGSSMVQRTQDESFLYLCEKFCDAYWDTSLGSTSATAVDGSSGTVTWEAVL